MLIEEYTEADLKTSYNVHDHLKELTVPELKALNDTDRLPYGVMTFNVSGDLNCGIIIRTAILMGAERVIVYGKRKYNKLSCVGSNNYIDINRVGGYDADKKEYDFAPFWNALVKYNYCPVFIEDTPTAYILTSDTDIINTVFNRTGMKPCLVFGSESDGIPFELLQQSRFVYKIPQLGVIRNLNVSAAASIAMWSIMSGYKR